MDFLLISRLAPKQKQIYGQDNWQDIFAHFPHLGHILKDGCRLYLLYLRCCICAWQIHTVDINRPRLQYFSSKQTFHCILKGRRRKCSIYWFMQKLPLICLITDSVAILLLPICILGSFGAHCKDSDRVASVKGGIVLMVTLKTHNHNHHHHHHHYHGEDRGWLCPSRETSSSSSVGVS